MELFREVDGQPVTDIDCQLPPFCSNMFFAMGADKIWDNNGLIRMNCSQRGFEEEFKPLFTMLPGEYNATHFFEIGDSGIYALEQGNNELFKIRSPDNVAGIVEQLNESGPELMALVVEPM
ncbi:hypothetical protein EDB82DRAFT_534656 [Fusarium venenatum]|uniref:uncharacterized protein n=1 Tax=Fusarium venenatum TaxID=56646 RepID=UPI001D518E74|nr:hypothetical protein EDB82DRAFT_534656 [Fusarium venenatum]